MLRVDPTGFNPMQPSEYTILLTLCNCGRCSLTLVLRPNRFQPRVWPVAIRKRV